MARKCGGCNQYGHNKRTCLASSKGTVVRDELVRPNTTDCVYELGQRIIIYYPWTDVPVVGIIDMIDYKKANVFLHDETAQKSYGFNWRTLDDKKVRVELLMHDKKISRRRKRTQSNVEED